MSFDILEKLRDFIYFWRYNTHPARLEAKSRHLVLFGANRALAVFPDKEFRRLAKFNQISEGEQNRIFNELTVTNLILLMLTLDQLAREAEGQERRGYLLALRQAVPQYFLEFIRRINIPKNLAEIWSQLVDLRYDQYCRDFIGWRGAVLNDGKLADFGSDNKLMIFQATVFGLYHHLVRGKVKKDDPLYRFLQTYLVFVYKTYLKKI